MRQGVNGDVEGEFLAVFGADAFAVVAGVVGAKGAAEAVFAHDGDEIALIEQAFQLNVARFVEATDALDFVKGTVDQVIVRNGLNFFIGEDPAELATPGFGKPGIGAATGREKETAMAEIFSKVFDLGVGEDELVVAIHEEE